MSLLHIFTCISFPIGATHNVLKFGCLVPSQMIRLLAKIQRKNQMSMGKISDDLKEKPVVQDGLIEQEDHTVEPIKEEHSGMLDKGLDLGVSKLSCLVLSIAAWCPHQQELDQNQEWLQYHHYQEQESKCEQELLEDADDVVPVGMESSLVATHQVIMEGYLEKKGHSTAFFMWPKYVVLPCVL